MRLTRKYFAEHFPCASHCASCLFFHSDVTIQELQEACEEFIKHNICLFADGYAFPCQFRSLNNSRPVRMPPKNLEHSANAL